MGRQGCKGNGVGRALVVVNCGRGALVVVNCGGRALVFVNGGGRAWVFVNGVAAGGHGCL